KGTIGFISPMSEPFCETCNRIRLTADGNLRLCLMHGDEVNLRDMMRAGATDKEIANTMLGGIWRKPGGHEAWEREGHPVRGVFFRMFSPGELGVRMSANAASGWLERQFKLSRLGTNVQTEIIAGLTTFMVMSYIIAVNPATLNMGGSGLDVTQVATVTCLIA